MRAECAWLVTGACVGTGILTPLAEKWGWWGGGKRACHSPRCPQNVMSVCVILIHPLQAASFHCHAPHKHRLRAMFVGLLLLVELKWGASTLSVSAETRERGQVCCRFKGRSGAAPVSGVGQASLVEDFRGSVGTSGLDNLLLWPRRLVFLCLALTHVDNHTGGGLCPCMELILFS